MTNAELLAKIKAAIERRKNYISVTHFAEELLSFLSTLESEKPVSNDLEKAADDYIGKVVDDGWEWETHDIVEAFIAGAKWQKEQDQETIKLSEINPFLAGVNYQKEQMIKDAVEWTVTTNLANRPVIYLDELHGFKYGDKVKIIIVKED